MEKYWKNEILDLIPTWREIADKGKQESGIRSSTSESSGSSGSSHNVNNVGATVRNFLSKYGKGDMMPDNRYFERREYRPMRDYVPEERRYDTMRRFYENPAFESRDLLIGDDIPEEGKPDNFLIGDYAPEERRYVTMRRFYENPAFDYLRRRSRYDQPNDMRDFMSDREPRKSFRDDPYKSYRNRYYQRFLKEDFPQK